MHDGRPACLPWQGLAAGAQGDGEERNWVIKADQGPGGETVYDTPPLARPMGPAEACPCF